MLDPVPTLLARVRAELAADFPAGTPVRVARAPGRLDVMGGIADYTGSMVCEATLDRAAAVALSARGDRFVQVFSFNLLDDNKPFTLRIPLDALAGSSAESLRREFAEPGRQWAAYLAGCLFVLHEQGYVDLDRPDIRGVNLALYSTVPLGAGVSSSAAIEVAAMMALADHYGVRREESDGASDEATKRRSDEGSRDSSGVASELDVGWASAHRDAPDIKPCAPHPPGNQASDTPPSPGSGGGLKPTLRDSSASLPPSSLRRSVASSLPLPPLSPLSLSALCQQVENRIVGAPCGVMDQVASCCGEAGSLLRMICQPHQLLPPLALPAGVRVLGIDSAVKHSVGGGQYGRTRCAAFMGHAIILDVMRRMGQSAGRELHADPTGGYLANVDPDDYKSIFRPRLPESIAGSEFLHRFGRTIDAATTVEPDHHYRVVQAADHHVLEARRVRQFAQFIEEATRHPHGTRAQGRPLDMAGHLMYASHLSYTNDALLGADECDLLVKLLRTREPAGIYGAKITGGGQGGTVAVLADAGDRVDRAIAEAMTEYEQQTGRTPRLFTGSSPGAWRWGTQVAE